MEAEEVVVEEVVVEAEKEIGSVLIPLVEIQISRGGNIVIGAMDRNRKVPAGPVEVAVGEAEVEAEAVEEEEVVDLEVVAVEEEEEVGEVADLWEAVEGELSLF